MTQEEVNKWNKMIAEFMEWKHLHYKINEKYKLYYHSSWDWLMPVVEKIRGLGFRVNITMSTIDNSVWITKGEERLNIVYYSDLKECLYVAVIKFLQWYNKHNTK